MRLLLAALFFLVLSSAAGAIGVDEKRLEDPVQEARAQAIMAQLRCLVCQNQPITESDAGLAGDLRGIVREQVLAGKTEQEILAFMTDRYGDWVLLKPPVRAATAFLWFGPLLLLLLGGGFVWRYVTRRPPVGAVAMPLTPEEEARLRKIMAEDGP